MGIRKLLKSMVKKYDINKKVRNFSNFYSKTQHFTLFSLKPICFCISYTKPKSLDFWLFNLIPNTKYLIPTPRQKHLKSLPIAKGSGMLTEEN